MKSRFIWLRSRVRSPRLPPPIGAMPSLRMNSESESHRNNLTTLGPHRFGRDPGQQQTRQIAEGQPGLTHSGHDQGVGAVNALVLKLVAGVSAGQGTQHRQPRHEARVGVRFTGPDKLFHLIEADEMAPRLGRRFAKRLHEPFPDREGSPDGSEALGLGQTGSISHLFSFAS